MRERAKLEGAFRAAVLACDPTARVKAAPTWDLEPAHPTRGRVLIPTPLGLAIGKAAMAMARGLPHVKTGLAIAPADDGRGLPEGWRLMIGGHPEPDERSLAAGDAAIEFVEDTGEMCILFALISGGASALCERPTVPLAEYRARIGALVAAGAPIEEVNAARTALSEIKGGKLAARCGCYIATIVASDVIGDDPRVVGSGPTVGRATDAVVIAAPMRSFAEAMAAKLEAPVLDPPIRGDVAAVAARLAAEPGRFVAWGEPTIALPAERGRGGRAQHLALLMARALAGTRRAALVAASDGVDGPPPAAAGAFVDGGTWKKLGAPEAALARFDSAAALGGYRFDPGATGINHGDVVAVL